MDKESLLMVITFHSLEERLIASAMQKWKKQKLGDQGMKKPLTATDIEL